VCVCGCVVFLAAKEESEEEIEGGEEDRREREIFFSVLAQNP
jgi:hypothetical protein